MDSQVDINKLKTCISLLLTSIGQVLRALATTKDDLCSLWLKSKLHVSRRKFQIKLSDVH